MNPLVLAGILKNFYDKVDVSSFEDRLKIQKIVYLMKVKEINLGYDFNLYLYGPYSKELARDAFQMADLADFSKVEKLAPAEKELQDKFLEFVVRMKSKKDNIKWLEIVASYIFIKNNLGLENDEEIIKRILSKRENMEFGEQDIKEIIIEINNGVEE